MKKGRRNCISLAGATVSALVLSAASFSASAEVINVPCDVSSLINAINTANSSPQDTTLNLARSCTYSLTSVNNEQENASHELMGPNGLPAIASVVTGGKLTMMGNESTVRRSADPATPPFRILQIKEGGDLTVSNLTIEGGSACTGTMGGGGILAALAKLSILNSALRNNVAVRGGGIVAAQGQLDLKQTSIENNRARNGGGLNADGVVNLSSSRIVGNLATDACPLINGNYSTDKGGAAVSGIVTITDSVIANNEAINIPLYGDGDGNTGGLYVGGVAGSVSTISNTTISGNRAKRNGGIYIDASDGTVPLNAVVQLNAVTITDNHQTDLLNTGNGLSGSFWDTNYARIFVKNSVVANNTIIGGTSGDCFEQVIMGVGGNNFDSDGSCIGFTHATVDALKLGALANNGGPTETHSLLPGSVAIDAAADCTTVDGKAITTDQRGVIRPQGKACDVGAFESGDELYVVNNLVSFNVVPGTAKLANDLVGCSGFAKKYRFSALLTNSSASSTPKTLTNLAMQVRKLSGGNKLFLDGSATPGTLYGEGEHTALPLAGGYADGQLAPRENETVGVNVCLTKVAPFQLLVDVLGKTQ